MSEYWITQDDIIFCDGDAGHDVPNHEAVVRKHCFDIIHGLMQDSASEAVQRVATDIEFLLEDNVVDAVMLRSMINDMADCLVDMGLMTIVEADDIHAYIRKNIELNDEWMYAAMLGQDMEDLRVYGVEKLGWHRVQNRSIQTANVSSRNLRAIADGLAGELHEDDIGGLWDIEANGVFFLDVPFYVIEAASPAGLASYRNRVLYPA